MKAQRQVLKIPEQSFRCFRRAEASFGYFRHYHAELELVYIEAGRGLLMIGERVLSWVPGDLFLLGPQLAHAWQSIDSGRDPWNSAVVLQIPAAAIARLLPEAAAQSLLERAPRGLRFDAGKTASQWSKLPEPHPLQAKRLGKLLLPLATAPSTILLDKECPELRRDVTQRLDRLLNWTHQRLDYPLSSAEAAGFLGVSLPSFCRFFRNAMGISYLDYVDEIRLATTCEALRQSSAPLGEILAAHGWRSASWFHRRFKAKLGRSPSAWRQEPEN
ncbi:MAG: hypothetical protein RL095_1395 [Verrucomicrobiota bacterium]|jgi:AraC-like DNA-binding protein